LRADDGALAELAASVADGSAVDWKTVEAQAGDNARRLVRHLRLVESISALHRSIPAEDTDGTSPVQAAPAGRPWGRLVLVESIGQGTSCEVFKAWDTELYREVAVKLLHSGHEADVLGEGRRLARLRHEHVVQVYGAEKHDGRVGLWMELVRGTSLEQLIQERGPLGGREAAIVGLDVCAALAAVHGAGLLHRDVKAQNVMREDGGRIVLMDFGTGEELAGTNRMVGTPLYLAPEIFRGQKASVQSDVYSVGVLLFYLVTGKFPVIAGSMQDLARAHANRVRQSLRDLRPDVSQTFVSAVERALESDPARRFSTVGELETALRESLVPATPTAVPAAVETPEPVKPGKRKLAMPFVAAAAALLAVVVGLIVWSRSTPASIGLSGSATRIAVLPFREAAGSSAAPYLADELTDQLISTLGQIRSIQVTSLSSVWGFRNRNVSIPEVARQLRVDDVVESTLLVIPGQNGKPDRVRIRARLIAAGTDTQIWAGEFERSLGDTLALQAEVARTIAEGIRAVLTPEERRRLGPQQTSTPEANDAYYQGLHYLNRSSTEGHRAVEAFRRATTLDPNHAGAHAGLARALMSLGFIGATSHPEARAVASAEVQRALALDGESSEAHAVQADLRFYYDWDWQAADESYRRAILLNPSFARARSQYARYLAAAGRIHEARQEAVRGTELEPTSASAVSTKAIVQYYARDYAAALSTIDHAVRLEPEAASGYFVRARVHAARGEIPAAIADNERALEIAGSKAATGWRAHLIWLTALTGAKAEAREALAKLPADPAVTAARLGPAHLAYVHEALGDRAAALSLLERAAGDREPDVLWLGVDPRVDSLRGDARFEQLLRRLGVPR
jgi:eukaryotic-like serine/threonine-protein kinase